VFDRIEDHNLPALLDAGLRVTINSDDPAYFGGYLNENFTAIQEAFALTQSQLLDLARNSFEAAYLDDTRRSRFVGELTAFAG
jgi:adenosine deaminase